MTIDNASFETVGSAVGQADGWAILSSATRQEVASLDALPGSGREDFSDGWGLPNWRYDLLEYDVRTDTITPLLTPALTTHAIHLAARVTANFGPTGVTLRIRYTNQDSTPDRLATIDIPGGSAAPTVWVAVLAIPDIGIKSVEDVTEVVPTGEAGKVVLEVSYRDGPFNESSLFAFVGSPTDLFREEFAGVGAERFEIGWDNDIGRLDDLDAIETEAAAFDVAAQTFEDFENEWRLPATDPGLPTNENVTWALHNFIDSTLSAPFVIVAGVNDRVRIAGVLGGTTGELEGTVAPGAYATATAAAAAIEATIDALLDADVPAPPDLDSGDFDAFASPTAGRVRLQIGDAAAAGIRLVGPATASAWAAFGFAVGVQTTRFGQVIVLDPAGAENFESGWRDNENSLFTFAPGNLEAALFDTVPQAVEDFENEWIIVMEP